MDAIEQFSSYWFEWQIRGLIVSVIVLFAAVPAHWRSPLWRHWVLVSGALILLLYPAVLILLPEWHLPIIPSRLLIDPFASPVRLEYIADERSYWEAVALVVSLVVAATLSLRYRVAWRKQLDRLDLACTPDSSLAELFQQCIDEVGLDSGRIELAIGSSNETPCTLGWVKPMILLPENALQWEPKDTRIVLIHELQHVKRRDWLWQQLTVLLIVFYPLNPAVWRIKSMVRALAEESVDKASLSLNITPMDYANALLGQLRACRQVRSSIAVHMHQRLDIAERVDSLIAEPYSWPNMGRTNYAQISIFMLFLALPIAVVRPVAMPADFLVREIPTPVTPAVEELGTPNLMVLVGPERPAPAVPIEAPGQPPGSSSIWLASFDAQRIELDVPVVASGSLVSEWNMPAEPSPIYLERPAYPKLALRRGWEATVNVTFDLDEQGYVINPRVLSSTSTRSSQFEQAALGAISASKYQVHLPKGQQFVTEGLTQTYVFELVENGRLSSSGNRPKNPP